MKRVLILAYYFPPIAASGSLRPLGFCQHLEKCGYIPHIVSTDPKDAHPPVNQDSDLLEHVPGSVRVDRLSHPNRLKQLLELRDRIMGSVKKGGKATAHKRMAPVSQQSASQPGWLSSAKEAILNRIFLFPDHQKPWIKAVEKYVARLPDNEKPDIVFATGNPWSGLVAGMRVAKKLGVPFVADFRDPWTRNPKPAPSETLHKLSCKLEKQVVKAADLIIANTEQLRQQFISDYPEIADKVEVVTNGYSEHLLELLQQVPEVDISLPFELCHFGSVYELRKPDLLLEALNKLVEEGRIEAGQLRLRFIGHWGVEDTDCNNRVKVLEEAGFLSREPALNHADYLRAMKQSQYLLILQQDFPLQIPGKLYEYIATGRPIVMVGGQGATADLIKQHHLGVTVDNTFDALTEFLLNFAKGECQATPPTAEAIEQFGYARLSARLSGLFDRLTADNVAS